MTPDDPTPDASPAPRIRILYLDLRTLAAEALDRLGATLDPSERARCERFRFAEDRRAYFAAHGLLRYGLSQLFPRPPADWRFREGPQGKPELVDPPPGAALAFNLSHCRTMVAAAFGAGPGLDVGVDVEAQDRAAKLDIGVARRFFAADEAARIEAFDDARASNAYFLRLWTLKEAVVKATGRGLSQPLDSFSLDVEPPRFLPRPDADLAPPISCWRLAQWPRQGHEIAAAAIFPVGEPTFHIEDAATGDLLFGS